MPSSITDFLTFMSWTAVDFKFLDAGKLKSKGWWFYDSSVTKAGLDQMGYDGLFIENESWFFRVMITLTFFYLLSLPILLFKPNKFRQKRLYKFYNTYQSIVHFNWVLRILMGSFLFLLLSSFSEIVYTPF